MLDRVRQGGKFRALYAKERTGLKKYTNAVIVTNISYDCSGGTPMATPKSLELFNVYELCNRGWEGEGLFK